MVLTVIKKTIVLIPLISTSNIFISLLLKICVKFRINFDNVMTKFTKTVYNIFMIYFVQYLHAFLHIPRPSTRS